MDPSSYNNDQHFNYNHKNHLNYENPEFDQDLIQTPPNVIQNEDYEDDVIIDREIPPVPVIRMKQVNLHDVEFPVRIIIVPKNNKEIEFILNKETKHPTLMHFLKELCENLNTKDELVLVTEKEERMIVDINAIEKGETLKLVRMSSEISEFKEKVNQIFLQTQQQQQQNMNGMGRGGTMPIRQGTAPGSGIVRGPGQLQQIPGGLPGMMPKRRGRPPKFANDMRASGVQNQRPFNGY
ncbi:hypothetical protein OXYTRIMIC_799 [Oxytricha trifallax]|uniref:Uncharacterized protein n=1 Tax=Oxytricha trifallax TaxID=1172189 RepID=A0A073I039_9SPIT|nr:hypothetical protein OXYTRIMIC_799 [Oxytricha trifallax]